MPKHSPLNDESEYFAQLGRMTIAAGIRYLQPQLNTWLEAKLQTLLADAGVAHNGVDKPRRSTKTLQAAEASLGALVGVSANGKKLGRPRKEIEAPVPVVTLAAPARKNGRGQSRETMKAYWSQFTDEQKRTMMAERMKKRSDPLARKILSNKAKARTKAKAGGPPPMIEGRYTKAGVAQFLGNASYATVDRRTRGFHIIKLHDPASPRSTPLSTYAVADIEALRS